MLIIDSAHCALGHLTYHPRLQEISTMYDVQNKTVMITGAAGGIGYKCAEILLRNGAKNVAVIDLSTTNGQNSVATLEDEFGKGRAVFFVCDVTKVDDFEKTFRKIVDAFGGLDIVINNAGVNNENHWKKLIEVNVNALIHGSMMAFDYMGKHRGGKGGVIANVSSVAGLHPTSFAPMYVASKYAVLGFSQSLARTCDKTGVGVRIVIMCPGYTITKMTENFGSSICDSISAAATELGNFESNVKPRMQTTDNVALAMLGLIQKGENGAVWVCEDDQSPYAVKFTRYSKRSLPV